MKKRIIILALSFFATIACAFGFAACKDGSQGDNSSQESVMPEFGLSQNVAELILGDSITLTVKNAKGDVEWTTSNPSIATVENGTITTLAFGTVEIKATSGTEEAICVVTVVPIFEDRTRLTLTDSSIRVYKSETYELGALAATGEQSTKVENVVWTTENPNIATVENGIVTAVNTGVTEITATIELNGKTLTASCQIEVILETNIVVNNETLLFTTKSEDLQLDISCTILDGTEKEIPISELEFSVAEDSTVVIDEDGTFSFTKGGLIDVTVSYKTYCTQTITLELYDNMISTAEEFLRISENPDGLYMLLTDIDFAGIDYTPIESFSGTLDGNGFAVRNISMAPPSPSGTAMFGNLSGTVRNISFENITINSIYNGMCGESALIASSFSGLLENVYVQGAVHGMTAIVTAWGTDYTTWNLKSSSLVKNANGGLMKDCIADITVDEGSDVKIFVAYGVLNVQNVYVYSSERLPSVNGDYAVVDNGECFIGDKEVTLEKASQGLDSDKWNFANEQVSLKKGISFKVPIKMHTVNIWNGEQLLATYEVETYQKLTPNKVVGDVIIGSFDYDFSKMITEDLDVQAICYTKISTLEQLRAISGTNGHYILMNDIDAENVTYANTTFLGDFAGVLEGNGYSIKNVKIQATNQWWGAGLFGTLSGTIRNIGLENITMLGGADNYLGKSGFVAQTITGKVINLYLTGTVSGVVHSNASWSAEYRYGIMANQAEGATIYNVRAHVDGMVQYSASLVAQTCPTHWGNYYASYTGTVTYIYGTRIPRDVGGTCLEASKESGDASAISQSFENTYHGALAADVAPYIFNSYWNMTTVELIKNIYNV